MRWNEIIRQRREEIGMSQKALAEAVGVSQPLIAKVESGFVRNTHYLSDILNILNLRKEDFPVEMFQEKSSPQRPIRILMKPPVPDFVKDPAYWATAAGLIGEVPLYASAEGGDGALIIERDQIGSMRRPPELQGVKDGYAIYHVGDSMIPEFEPGDTLYVNPRLTPIAQTTCVFYNTSADEPRAMVKRYLGESDDSYRVMQHNPHRVFDLLKSEWGARHRVIARYMR